MSRFQINDDPDFTETIDSLHRLHDKERQQPDADFVHLLRNSLMSNTQSAAANAPRTGSTEWAGGEARRWRPERRWTFDRFSTVATIAAVALLIASASWFALRGRSGDPDSRGTYAAVTAATPVVEDPRVAQADLPVGVVWQIPLADGERLGIRAVTISNGVVYRLIRTSDFKGVEAISATDGSLLWRHHGDWVQGGVSSTSRGLETIAADEHFVYVLSGNLQALEISTGEAAWLRPLPAAGENLIASNGQLFLWQSNRTLTALDSSTGDIQWTFDGATAEGVAPIGAGPAVFEGIVIVVTGLGKLEAIDRETGESIWMYEDTFDSLNVTIAGVYVDDELTSIVMEAISFTRPESGDDERRAAKIILSLDPVDGTVNWREEVFSSIGTNIAVSGETVIQIVDDLEAEIVPRATPDPNVGPPIVTQVVGRSAATGEIIWTHAGSEGSYFFYVGGPETVFARENHGPTALLDASDGTALCNLPDEVSVNITHGVTEYGFVIASLVDGSLGAIDPITACVE